MDIDLIEIRENDVVLLEHGIVSDHTADDFGGVRIRTVAILPCKDQTAAQALFLALEKNMVLPAFDVTPCFKREGGLI